MSRFKVNDVYPGDSRDKGEDGLYYTIGVVSEMYGVHPQTLRLYDREGLLKPVRTSGNTRLYSRADVQRLEMILRLTRELGVNRAGTGIILDMRDRQEEMLAEIRRMLRSIRDELRGEVADIDRRIDDILQGSSVGAVFDRDAGPPDADGK